MALTIIGTSVTSLQRGVELAETGLLIRTFTVRYFPLVREFLEDNLGEKKALVVSNAASREVTIEGEYNGGPTMTFLAAFTPANDVADFGSPSGGLYATEITVTQERAGWRSFSAKLESNPGIT